MTDSGDPTSNAFADTPAPAAGDGGAMTQVGVDGHSAAASVLGYAFQIQSGLLELLRARASHPDMRLSIEMHDDIAWESSTGLIALKQYKLHQSREGHLGDSSVDLWKTLGVWLDKPSPADPLGPQLWLVTTAIATEGSIAALLREGDGYRPSDALVALEERAQNSGNQETAKVRAKFLQLTAAERAVFVGRIRVADGSGDLAAVEAEVANHLLPGAPYDHVDSYLEQVWGWWNKEVLRYLRSQRPAVGVQEMLRALDRIRNEFTEGNLPPMVDRAEVDIDQVMVKHSDRLYVHQLRQVGVVGRPLTKAVMDYQRAYLQSTRWLKRNLVDYAEIEAFSEDLLDEWEREYDEMCRKLPKDATEDDKATAGRDLLRELQNSALTIRAFRDPFFARGQRHALADDEKIGWHPDFEVHLREFLLGA